VFAPQEPSPIPPVLDVSSSYQWLRQLLLLRLVREEQDDIVFPPISNPVIIAEKHSSDF